jgi:hypothetical protein
MDQAEDFWGIRVKAPELYEEWKAAVAAGETTAGLLIWVAHWRPDEFHARVKNP